jgi:hypothetical protein
VDEGFETETKAKSALRKSDLRPPFSSTRANGSPCIENVRPVSLLSNLLLSSLWRENLSQGFSSVPSRPEPLKDPDWSPQSVPIARSVITVVKQVLITFCFIVKLFDPKSAVSSFINLYPKCDQAGKSFFSSPVKALPFVLLLFSRSDSLALVTGCELKLPSGVGI